MNTQSYWSNIGAVIAEYGLKVLAAAAILGAAIIIGYALRKTIAYIVNHTSLGRTSEAAGQDLGNAIGKAFFWIIILIALPAALGALGMKGLLVPMQTMAQEFLAFLPNLVGAGLIFGIGWVIAIVVKRALTSILAAAQADKLAARFGLAKVTGETGVSNFAGILAFTLLIIPIAIAALDALGMESISAPAKLMLQNFLNAIPNIFGAAIILLLAYIIGRFASDALTNLLPTLGFDQVGKNIGLADVIQENTSLSKIAGYITFFVIMVFGLIEAAKLLNFDIISNLLTLTLSLGAHILLGSIIIILGVIAAEFVANIASRSKAAKSVAGLLKVAIIVLATAMGLQQMGVADEIVNIGFALLLGALAVGMAIAIGWGGKDTAARLLEKWTRDL